MANSLIGKHQRIIVNNDSSHEHMVHMNIHDPINALLALMAAILR